MKVKLLTTVVIVQALLSFSTLQNINNVKATNEELNTQITEQMDRLKESYDTIDSLKNDLSEMENLLNEKDAEYKSLKEKYDLEVAPVSFNENYLLQPSNVTLNKLKFALKGTGLEGLEKAYLDSEKEYGINAIFLVSLTAEESWWGKSRRAKEQNNLSGFEVYSDNSKGKFFSSKYESILTTAKILKRDYLTQGGIYHKGYDIRSVNKSYCPVNGFSWSKNISSIAYDLVNKINNR